MIVMTRLGNGAINDAEATKGDADGVPSRFHRMVRVAIIDDQGVFRSGLGHAIDGVGGLVVVAENANGGAPGEDVHVVVVSEMGGRWVQVVATTRSRRPSPPSFVLVVDTATDAIIAMARDQGVASCVPRTAGTSAFVRAIDHAARSTNGRPPPPSATEPPFPGQPSSLPLEGGPTGQIEVLDKGNGTGATLGIRDVELLSAVAAGLSNKQVGERLGLSDQTVKNRLSAILRKLEAVDRTEAVVTAIRRGWLRIEAIEAVVIAK